MGDAARGAGPRSPDAEPAHRAPAGTTAADPAHAGAARRTLAACCGAHALHDGFTDLLYVLLPVWQQAFGLSLAQAGLLKTLYSGSMAALQVPSSLVAERAGERAVLALGTLVAAAGFLAAGWAGGFAGLAACHVLGGVGASVQHPIGSSLKSRAFEGPRLRAALGTYNFAGECIGSSNALCMARNGAKAAPSPSPCGSA